MINRRAIIGENCTIFHNVTIGVKGIGEDTKLPFISDNVYIGTGATIIGGVHIGKYAVIGANSVVTKDIPDKAVVAGNPARIIKYL